ncbi:MAG TPA: hypothetical protein VFF33_10745 [Ignavibacteriaceae bacterium]|nr:hypothetical protein [Ignavibacteriaceae bacterium]
MNKYFPLVIIIFSLLFLQCREDIVAPGNAAGVINEPVIQKTRNSYTFLINAQNFTIDLSDFLSFNNTKVSLLLDIEDYETGTSIVNVLNQKKDVIFSKVASDNINNLYERLDGNVPGSLLFKFENFTGKLRLEIISL